MGGGGGGGEGAAERLSSRRAESAAPGLASAAPVVWTSREPDGSAVERRAARLGKRGARLRGYCGLGGPAAVTGEGTFYPSRGARPADGP